MSGPDDDWQDDLRGVARALLAGAAPGEDLDWPTVARAGWTGLELPGTWDGAGVGFGAVGIVAVELGRVAAAGPFLGAAVGAAGALRTVEPGPVVAECARSLADGTAIPVLVLDAQDPPADVSRFPFTLAGAGSGTEVSGVVEFVVDAPFADMLLLPARDTNGAPSIVAVVAHSPGVTIESRPVVDATRRIARVQLDGVVVDDAHCWALAGDPESWGRRLADRAALGVAFDSVGIAEAMLETTVDYVSEREQFGRPIGSFQAVKHACAQMKVTVTASRAACAEALDALDALEAGGGESARPDRLEAEAGDAVDRAAALAKQGAVEVAGSALQLHGGIGYTWDSGIHVYLKRAALNRSLHGSPQAHRRRLAARWT